MKKIFSILMIVISAAITIYTVVFWEPTHNITFNSLSEKEKNEGVYNKEEAVEKDNAINNEKNIALINSNEESKEVIAKTSAFKFTEEEMERLIPKSSKEKVKDIVKKLSTVDIIKVKECFNNENKEEGLRDGFNLIRTRISENDYEEIKNILSEYIDFDSLEIEV